nr:integrase, catalytic region, zinc finger, CCHC-type, peptidase aspartic, catalytic [Tanacetum cinerariifolium]
MTGNLQLLINFVEKFLETVKFGNDQIAPILGYGDLGQGTVTIKRVYYVEGLNHNLFSVGQFCDADLEVAFMKSTCFIRDLKRNDLLTGLRETDLYLITLQATNSPNPICLVAKCFFVLFHTVFLYFSLLDFWLITPSHLLCVCGNYISFMGDEHLDTIPATESDEFIKSGVETLIPIPSESEGIPDHMCDVSFLDNSPPLDVSKNQFEDFSESNEEFSSTDDDSFSFDNIDYVEASPPDSELVSSKVMEIVIPEVGGIKASNDNPIPFYDPIIPGTPSNLTPSGESDFFLEGDMLLFEAFLNDDHSSDFQTKSSSTSLNSLLEETNNFDNSLPEFTTISKVLCDAECKSDSSDDQSCSDEDVLKKIISKPLSEEEIIPMKSLRTHDSSLLISSKIDSLLDEFAGELTLLKSIPPGIDETDCDFEEDI